MNFFSPSPTPSLHEISFKITNRKKPSYGKIRIPPDSNLSGPGIRHNYSNPDPTIWLYRLCIKKFKKFTNRHSYRYIKTRLVFGLKFLDGLFWRLAFDFFLAKSKYISCGSVTRTNVTYNTGTYLCNSLLIIDNFLVKPMGKINFQATCWSSWGVTWRLRPTPRTRRTRGTPTPWRSSTPTPPTTSTPSRPLLSSTYYVYWWDGEKKSRFVAMNFSIIGLVNKNGMYRRRRHCSYLLANLSRLRIVMK